MPNEKMLLSSAIERFVNDNLLLAINETIHVDGDSVGVGLYRVIPRANEYAVMVGRKRIAILKMKSWALALAMMMSVGAREKSKSLVELSDDYARLTDEWNRFEILKKKTPVTHCVYEDRQSRLSQLIEIRTKQIFTLIDSEQIWQI